VRPKAGGGRGLLSLLLRPRQQDAGDVSLSPVVSEQLVTSEEKEEVRKWADSLDTNKKKQFLEKVSAIYDALTTSLAVSEMTHAQRISQSTMTSERESDAYLS
jgi:hypothetical protein